MPDDSGQVSTRPHVRVATVDEVHAVMALALMGTAENGFVPGNPLKILENVYPSLSLDHGIVGVIGAPGAELEGAVLLRIGPLWYSDADILEEKAIFIHPAYRNARGGRAARLCEFSMECADMLGLPLCIGVLSAHRTAAKVRMYSRMLGEPSGAYWVYMPNSRAT